MDELARVTRVVLLDEERELAGLFARPNRRVWPNNGLAVLRQLVRLDHKARCDGQQRRSTLRQLKVEDSSIVVIGRDLDDNLSMRDASRRALRAYLLEGEFDKVVFVEGALERYFRRSRRSSAKLVGGKRASADKRTANGPQFCVRPTGRRRSLRRKPPHGLGLMIIDLSGHSGRKNELVYEGTSNTMHGQG